MRVWVSQANYDPDFDLATGSHQVAAAQPEFMDQWTNFNCVRKKRWTIWAEFLLMGQKNTNNVKEIKKIK